MATAPTPNLRRRAGLDYAHQGHAATDQQYYIHAPYCSEAPGSNISVLVVLEGFMNELLILLAEFEATKCLMQGNRFVQCARPGSGLHAQLSHCLGMLQQMASALQQKVVPMQQLTTALKQAGIYLQEQLSTLQAAQIHRFLSEMRPLCQRFAYKLRELRTLASRVLDLAFQRARKSKIVKTIKIDCSAVAVLLLFLLGVWVSRLLPQSM